MIRALWPLVLSDGKVIGNADINQMTEYLMHHSYVVLLAELLKWRPLNISYHLGDTEGTPEAAGEVSRCSSLGMFSIYRKISCIVRTRR